MRKAIRMLNRLGRQKISRSFKPIREKSIIRIIEPEAQFIRVHGEAYKQIE